MKNIAENIVENTVENIVKTPEQLAEDVVKKKVQNHIKGLVDQLLKEDFTIHELGYAADAFGTWLQIRTAKTQEHENLLKAFKEVNEANDRFSALKSNELTYLEDEDKLTPSNESQEPAA